MKTQTSEEPSHKYRSCLGITYSSFSASKSQESKYEKTELVMSELIGVSENNFGFMFEETIRSVTSA